MPIHEVLAHLTDIPHRRLWVHCTSGYRASVVATILDVHDFDVATDETFVAASTVGPALTPAS